MVQYKIIPSVPMDPRILFLVNLVTIVQLVPNFLQNLAVQMVLSVTSTTLRLPQNVLLVVEECTVNLWDYPLLPLNVQLGIIVHREPQCLHLLMVLLETSVKWEVIVLKDQMLQLCVHQEPTIQLEVTKLTQAFYQSHHNVTSGFVSVYLERKIILMTEIEEMKK